MAWTVTKPERTTHSSRPQTEFWQQSCSMTPTDFRMAQRGTSTDVWLAWLATLLHLEKKGAYTTAMPAIRRTVSLYWKWMQIPSRSKWCCSLEEPIFLILFYLKRSERLKAPLVQSRPPLCFFTRMQTNGNSRTTWRLMQSCFHHFLSQCYRLRPPWGWGVFRARKLAISCLYFPFWYTTPRLHHQRLILDLGCWRR